MRALVLSFYLVASARTRWVTSSSTGAIQENLARVLVLGKKQNVVLGKGSSEGRRCLKSNVEELAGGALGEAESELWLPPLQASYGSVKAGVRVVPPRARNPFISATCRNAVSLTAASAQTGTV